MVPRWVTPFTITGRPASSGTFPLLDPGCGERFRKRRSPDRRRGYDTAVKGAVTALLVFTLVAVGATIAYQTLRREREYRALLARGDVALRADETFGAIEAYSGAIALRPDSMLPHLRRGETYLRRGELEAAA